MSRALGTLHKDKALPPLGQALDMRDSRPAENSTGPCDHRGSYAPRPGFTDRRFTFAEDGVADKPALIGEPARMLPSQ